MKKKIKKHTLFTIASLAVILASGFIVFSLLSQLSDASNDYLEEKESLTEELVHEERLKEVEHEEVLQNLESLENLFSDPNRPITNILFLEKTLENNNLEGSVSTGERVTDSNPWPYLEFDVQIEGQFTGVLNFITEVRSGEKLLAIEGLSVQAVEENEDDDEDEREVSANLTVKAYFLD